jgi:RecB family exonuclease
MALHQRSSAETHFFRVDKPLLPQVAAFLIDRVVNSRSADLSDLLCVLPSSRSSSDLKQILLAVASDRGIDVKLPALVTTGELAERLYQPAVPVALELEQTLAWARVLQATEPEELRPLLPVDPDRNSLGPWLDLGGTLRRLHEELASYRRSFADVAASSESEGQQRRWQLLTKLFADYLRELSHADLCDPHQARRQAVEAGCCRTDKTVALIGTVDLNPALTAMLRSLRSPLLAMVAAPQSWADRFDAFGNILTAAWLDHQLNVTDDQFLPAGDMPDQAQAVAESISQLRADYSPDQITVGVTDSSHVAPVEFELRGCGLPSYRHLGWTLAETAIGRLLNLISTHLRRQTWQSLAALVRHADVAAMISERLQLDRSQWLTELDQLLATCYPIRLADQLPNIDPVKTRVDVEVPRQVAAVIDQWLAAFDSASAHTIADWSTSLSCCLDRLYAQRGDRPIGQRTQISITAARHVLDRLSTLNSQLDMPIDSTAAIEMLTARLSDVRIGEPRRPNDIQIAGWLDLALDVSPVLIVVGMNHPFVPSTVTSDPFLPGSLRAKLGLADNDRRLARDVYAASLMLSTRPRTMFIVGQRSADGSPTPPSRLLSAAASCDSARRVLRLLTEKRPSIAVNHRWDHGPERTELPPPKFDLQGRCPLDSMSVTAFRDYLICPYRFYLRHVLQQKPLDDLGAELAANQFGDLIHDTLERFGKSDAKHETHAERIEQALVEYLHQIANERFGNSVTTAVRLQIEQARRRLQVVAQRQADRIAEGWQIIHVETSAGREQGCGIEVDGNWMTLKGRFDRIDYHPQTGRWAILDYKTHGHPPHKKHLKKTPQGIEWIDLQLPLYRQMIPFLGINANPTEVQLGYFNISQAEQETKVNIADFDDSLMAEADKQIRNIIADIFAGKFEPKSDVEFDDYAMIVQAGIPSNLVLGEIPE